MQAALHHLVSLVVQMGACLCSSVGSCLELLVDMASSVVRVVESRVGVLAAFVGAGMGTSVGASVGSSVSVRVALSSVVYEALGVSLSLDVDVGVGVS